MSTAKGHIELDPKLSFVIASSSTDFPLNTQRTLKTGGFNNVLAIAQPNALIQHCQTHKVDVLICDLLQESVDAWQLIKSLKTSDSIPNIPIIFTGKGECPVGAKELSEYGIPEYLKQPFDLRSLMNTLVSTYSAYQRHDTTEGKYSAAKRALINNNGTEAIETYTDLFDETNHSARSTVGLAQAYEKNRDLHQAQKILAESSHTEEVGVMQMSLKVALSTDRLSDAQMLVQNILKATAFSEMYFKTCLETCANSKAWGLVQKIVKAAFKRSLHGVDFYIFGARASYNLEIVDEAMQLLAKVEEMSGPSLRIYEIRGRCQLKLQDYGAAVKTYTLAVNLDPKNPQSYFNRALAYLSTGRISEAEVDLNQCLKISPTFVLAAQKLKEIRSTPRKAS